MSSGRAAAGKRASITGAASVRTSANGRALGAPAGRPEHSTSHAQEQEPSQERGHSIIRLEPGPSSQSSSPEGSSSPDDSMTLTAGDIRDIHHLARLKEEVSLNALPNGKHPVDGKHSLDDSQGLLGYAELHHHESVAHSEEASDFASSSDSPSPRVGNPRSHSRPLGAHEIIHDTRPREAYEFSDLPLSRVGVGAASMADSDAGQNHHHPILGAHELTHELTQEPASSGVGAGKEMLSLVYYVFKCPLFNDFIHTISY